MSFAGYHESLKDQLASRAQGAFEFKQVIKRGAPMIEDSHGEDRVECFKVWGKVFRTQGKQVDRPDPCVAFKDVELGEEVRVGIDPKH